MPTYDYKCEDCGKTIEVSMSIRQLRSQIKCDCGGTALRQYGSFGIPLKNKDLSSSKKIYPGVESENSRRKKEFAILEEKGFFERKKFRESLELGGKKFKSTAAVKNWYDKNVVRKT